MSEISAEELKQGMEGFYGTEHYYQDMACKLTDGMKFVVDKAGAGWLAVDIGTESRDLARKGKFEGILFWRLTVKMSSADLEALLDIPGKCVFKRHYEFTDFPEGVWVFYYQDGVLFLPSEY